MSPITVDSTFNFFAADVTMRMTGVRAPGQPELVRTITYHVERVLGTDGVWTTTTTLLGAQPFGTPADGGVSTVDIAKVVAANDGTVGQVYDRQNNPIATPPAMSFEALIQRSSRFRSRSQSARPAWPARSAGVVALAVSTSGMAATHNASSQRAVVRRDTVAGAADPRAWVRQFVVMPAQRDGMKASIGRRFGAAVGQVGGLERYTRTVGTMLHEALVDSASGIILEENTTENGQLRVRTVHRFTPVPNGALVRLGSRSEIAGTPGATARMTVETTYSNLRIETRGGAR